MRLFLFRLESLFSVHNWTCFLYKLYSVFHPCETHNFIPKLSNMQDNREQIAPRNIEEEMQTCYLDYAMSVIVGRALPDVRDGLKPVHRRVIYGMHQLGFGPTHKTEKCAKSVGHVMGNYHPHGDAAIYDTLVRLAQDFTMRYTLIEGQGNFGSIDGDPAAAMRYTESRLSSFSSLMLQDLDKNSVDMVPNYDGSDEEPSVLPSAFPNLLVNGSDGIAVGMATNIPPHNLGETIDACIEMIDNPHATVKDLMKHIKGPDFPTGAYIYGRQGIVDAYTTGRGRIIMRARISTEQLKGGREAIVVTEIPYAVNKSRVIEKIALLVKEKKITGISELRDESDAKGIRIVMELKRGEIPDVIINNLYKHTQLQETFGAIMLALVDGRPRYLSLPKMIHLYLKHRNEIIVRRTRYDLDKAEKRLHIVHGLCLVQDNIDAIVKIIRNASTPEDAKKEMMARFKLQLELALEINPNAKGPVPMSAIQADAILAMRLSRLTQLEKNKLFEERAALVAEIKRLRHILSDNNEVWAIVRSELLAIRDKYADERRTEIIDESGEFAIEDLIADENMIITISHAGYIKRTNTALYRKQRRGGKGVTAAETKEEDWIEHLFVGTTHNYLLIFTDKGRCYWLRVFDLPEGGRTTKGRPIVNLLQLEKDETVRTVLATTQFDDEHFLIFATAQGQVCRQALSLYSNPRKGGIKAIKIADNDNLVDVKLTNGQSEIILATRNNMACRFHETDARSLGRDTGGVRGITLVDGDVVIGLETPRAGASLLTVCENGFGKRSAVEDYRMIHRGGKGVKNIKSSERNGAVVAIKEVIDEDEFILVTREGISLRTKVKDLRIISRVTQGVRLINLTDDDVVMSVARIAEKDDDDETDDQIEETPAIAKDSAVDDLDTKDTDD